MAANGIRDVAGRIVWMHMLPPAKMWIRCFNEYKKPPSTCITVRTVTFRSILLTGFMNQNQSAHGDREFAHTDTYGCGSQDNIRSLDNIHTGGEPYRLTGCVDWLSARLSHAYMRHTPRWAIYMRNVAVTEGDKVEAHQVRLKSTIQHHETLPSTCRLFPMLM